MTAVTTDKDGMIQDDTQNGAGPDATVSSLSRRRVFAMCSLGVLGAAGLAACGSDDEAAPGTATTPSAAGTTAGSTEATATATATAEAGGSGGASLIALADVPVGGAVSLEVDGKPVIVAQPEAGEAVGFSAVCPHQFATVAVSGDELRCPLHGSTFDIATGKNLTGPAAGKPLPAFAVSVKGDQVVQG